MYKTVKPTTFILPLALLEDLDAMAKELGKKTAIVSEALEMYMDLQDLKIAQKRLNDKSDKQVSADKFFKDIGV